MFGRNNDNELINKILFIFKINRNKLIKLKELSRKNVIDNYSLKNGKNYELFFKKYLIN